MPKINQNLVMLLEPESAQHIISLKGGNMSLNRFCIDEDAAFELSGVCRIEVGRKSKGKDNYSL